MLPSYWKIEEMSQRFGADNVVYLPPPIESREFSRALWANMRRRGKKRKFVHVIGTSAHYDRNGTGDLLKAVSLAKSDFELVIRTQQPIYIDAFRDDKRITYVRENLEKNEDLYIGYDALLLPRRWGGQSLPMSEALMSGLPVLSTDINPQNKWLPSDWLVEAKKEGSFMVKGEIDFYSVNHQAYADLIDEYATLDVDSLKKQKMIAYELGVKTFNPEILLGQYIKLFDL